MELKSQNLKTHPDFDNTIEEVINKNYDEELMLKALSLAKSVSQAEAIYVILTLKDKHCSIS